MALSRPTSRREFYYDETEIDMMERQLIDDENYGIWN